MRNPRLLYYSSFPAPHMKDNVYTLRAMASQSLYLDLCAIIEARAHAAAAHTYFDVGVYTDVLFATFRATGRLTLLTPNTNFNAVLQQCRIDAEFSDHITDLLKQYAYGSGDLTTGILQDGVGIDELMDYLVLVEMNGTIVDENDTFVCENCDDRCSMDDLVLVRGRHGNDSSFCNSCAEGSAFHCEISDRWYDDSYYNSGETEDGITFCQEVCLNDGSVVAVDDEDGITAYYRAGNEPAHTHLPGYHDGQRNWIRQTFLSIPERAVGVELELGFHARYGRDDFLSECVGERGRVVGMPFCVERDGSLDSVPNALELISEPLDFYKGYVAKDAPWRQMLTLLKSYSAEGWQWREYAGIHVNQDTRHLTDENIVKYAVFVNTAAGLSKYIAGRKHIYNFDAGTRLYSGGYKRLSLPALENAGASMLKRFCEDNGKYSPVYIHAVQANRTHYMETRIFGSNLKYEGFMACVEYCIAATEYVQTVEFHEVFNPIVASLFRMWLRTQTKRYPNLCARLGIAEGMGVTAKIIPLRAVA